VIQLAETADCVASCELARLEVACVIQRHLREERLAAARANEIWKDFEADERNGDWTWLPTSSHLLRAACDRARALPATVFLRSADALHLTCAKEHGFAEVYSNHRHVLAAASHFGLNGINLLH
jgi:predicted nucleic acid-binding protein